MGSLHSAIVCISVFSVVLSIAITRHALSEVSETYTLHSYVLGSTELDTKRNKRSDVTIVRDKQDVGKAS